jgi:methyl-accepting chemotaxis protein
MKSQLFGADYVEVRAKTVKEMVETGKTSFTAVSWLELTTKRLATALDVAEVALDTAQQHAGANRASALQALIWQLALLAGAVLGSLALMAFVARRVTSPLQKIQQAMLKVANGDMTAEAAFPGRTDEIGKLAEAMTTFRDAMLESERLRSAQKVSEERTAQEQRAARQRLADEFQAAVGRIVDSVSTAAGGLEASAGTLTSTADTTLRLAGVVSSASQDASVNVGTVASATEEMSGSVHEIARQVQESSRIAAEAVAQAQATDARIGELSQAASRIGDVVKLITAIAEQTNLLALNATIEAARAGEAGRGFAVVASEVKALASQTAKATEEIGSQVAGMQTATQDSVAAIKEIGGTIGRISEIAAAIAAAVEEQGAATSEIARNVQEAARGTSQVADTISEVNRGASETGAASSQVLASARSLAQESAMLKSEVTKFLETVRAA